MDREDPNVHPLEGLMAVRLDERVLYFANAAQLKDRLMRLERYRDSRAHPAIRAGHYEGIECIILDFSHVASIDASAASVLSEVCAEYLGRGIAVWAVGLRGKALAVWSRCGLGGGDPGDRTRVRDDVDTVAAAVVEVQIHLLQSSTPPSIATGES